MKPSHTAQRQERLLQQALGVVFQQEVQPAFPQGLVTVTNIEVGTDLDLATVHVSVLGTDAQQVLTYCNDNATALRGALGRKVSNKLRHIPTLRFLIDDSAAYATQMERVFTQLKTSSHNKKK